MAGLVQKIADKFGLNKDDVQQVFDEDRAAHEAEMQQKFEDELSQAVTDGKLTEEQKSAILTKREELKSQRDANKDSFATKSRDEIKSEMDAKRAELEQWAKDNSIPTEYLRFVFGGRGHGGPGGPGMRGGNEDTFTQSSEDTSAN